MSTARLKRRIAAAVLLFFSMGDVSVYSDSAFYAVMQPYLLDRFYDAMYTNCTITNSTLGVEGQRTI